MDLRKLLEGKNWSVVYGLALWAGVQEKWGRKVFVDKSVVSAIERLIEVYEQVRGIKVDWDSQGSVRGELERFLEWVVIDNGRSLRYAYRMVPEFFQRGEDDEVVDEFVRSYVRYVKERFGMDCVLTKGPDVRKAAMVTKRMAEKYGISMYQVIKFQHEWWEEGIRTPFTPKALGREDKVEERLQKYFAKRKGEVIERGNGKDVSIANEPGVYFLKRRWQEVLSMGPTKFLQVARGGFLVDMVKQMLEELGRSQDKRAVLQKYNDEYVVQEWVRRGKPMILV